MCLYNMKQDSLHIEPARQNLELWGCMIPFRCLLHCKSQHPQALLCCACLQVCLWAGTRCRVCCPLLRLQIQCSGITVSRFVSMCSWQMCFKVQSHCGFNNVQAQRCCVPSPIMWIRSSGSLFVLLFFDICFVFSFSLSSVSSFSNVVCTKRLGGEIRLTLFSLVFHLLLIVPIYLMYG